MRRFSARIVLAGVAVVVACTASVWPALAASTPQEVVAAARIQNSGILNEYTGLMLLATTQAELAGIRANADYDLDVVWYSSLSQLDAMLDADPSLEGAVADAKATLESDHNGAHAEIAGLYSEIHPTLPPGTSTTTTTSTTTSTSTSTTSTSTTSTSTTTTTTRPSTTTTTRPPTTTTTRPSATIPSTTSTTVTTTTLFLPDRTTTTTTPAVVVPRTPGGGDATPTDPGFGSDPAMAMGAAFSLDDPDMEAALADETQAAWEETGAMSARITAGASVYLPPDLLRLAVGPIVLVEVLLRTLGSSLESMLVPILLLVVTAGLMIWREARRAREVEMPT